jgi:D-sedoheptulose 7-phosphate isomerase
MTDLRERLRRVRDEHVRLVDAFLDRHAADLDRLSEWCAAAFRAGGKVLFFGNGGSAADAQHLAAEFVNRYDRDRRALGAIALATDGSTLTSIGNDSEFARIFSRQIEALGRPGDVAVGITTSGTSPNVLEGLRAARRSGLRTAALLGRDGGEAASLADLALVVPGRETARIQEVHILAGHLVCERVEEILSAGVPIPPRAS